jgi:hypothetical protein
MFSLVCFNSVAETHLLYAISAPDRKNELAQALAYTE